MNPREIGISVSGYTFNSFAAEWYMQKFGFNLSGGVFYRKQLNAFRLQQHPSFFRVGYQYSGQPIITEGGENNLAATVTGKQRGSEFYAGYEKQILEKNSFMILLGADVALARFSFKGQCYSYRGDIIYNENKKMIGAGFIPFAHFSYTFNNLVRVSVESSFSNWFIRQNTLLQDPIHEVKKHYFVSSPNPVNAVTVSYLF